MRRQSSQRTTIFRRKQIVSNCYMYIFLMIIFLQGDICLWVLIKPARCFSALSTPTSIYRFLLLSTGYLVWCVTLEQVPIPFSCTFKHEAPVVLLYSLILWLKYALPSGGFICIRGRSPLCCVIRGKRNGVSRLAVFIIVMSSLWQEQWVRKCDVTYIF